MADKPESEQEKMGISVPVATFIKLHQGLTDCDCLSFDGIREDCTSQFARLLRRETGDGPISDLDFESHYEIPITPLRPRKRCKEHCDDRGVSINQLDNSNLNEIKKKYETISAAAGYFGSYYCTFRLKDKAGKVWDTKPDDQLKHHNFFKCDHFTVDEVVKLNIEHIQ